MTQDEKTRDEIVLQEAFDRTAHAPSELTLRRMAARAESVAPRRSSFATVATGALALAAAAAVYVATRAPDPPSIPAAEVTAAPAARPARVSPAGPSLGAPDTGEPALAELDDPWGTDFDDELDDPDAWLLASAAGYGDGL